MRLRSAFSAWRAAASRCPLERRDRRITGLLRRLKPSCGGLQVPSPPPAQALHPKTLTRSLSAPTRAGECAASNLVATVWIASHGGCHVIDINVFVRPSQRNAEREAVGLARIRQQVKAGKLKINWNRGGRALREGSGVR
jgi:hypothetical protein